LSTFLDALERDGHVLAVTFDDAERSLLEGAVPVLERLGGPATVFVATATIGSGPVLDEAELRELAERGWEIGSHGHSHVALTGLDDETLADELRLSRARVGEVIGAQCRSIAYPYGAVDDRVAAAAAAAGYEAGCALGAGRAGDPLRRPRIGIDGNDGDFVFRIKVSAPARALRASPAGPALSRAARALKRR
jgi:peptidoglycan/xylan/chitin deacetylase (PgdA/CDA1 family)